MYKVGIDLGGTKIEGVILDSDNNQIIRKRIPTEQQKGYNSILQNINQLYKTLLEEINNSVHSLGIGTPGSISSKTGLMRNSNTQCLNGKSILADLTKLLNKKIVIENDANCFALAETLLNEDYKNKLVFGVIMGTGCGSGIVYEGKLIKGLLGNAGEWGHSIIEANGRDCWCGKRGCVEQYISGGALESFFATSFNKNLLFSEILENYRNQQEPELTYVKEFINYFSLAISNIINIIDPNVVVLGGGLSNVDELYTLGVEGIKKNVFSDMFETEIVKNKYGDSAGVLGAALIGAQ